MLKILTAIQELDLSDNNFGPDGATALAGVLKFLTTLEWLNRSHNSIGSNGAIDLASEMHCLTKFRYCNLRKNNIDLVGVNTFMKKCDHVQAILTESFTWNPYCCTASSSTNTAPATLAIAQTSQSVNCVLL